MANKKRNQPRLSQDAPLCRPVGPTENGTTLFTRGNPIDCKCYLLTPPNTAGWRRVSFPRNAGACPYDDRKTADFQNRETPRYPAWPRYRYSGRIIVVAHPVSPGAEETPMAILFLAPEMASKTSDKTNNQQSAVVSKAAGSGSKATFL